MTRLSTLRALLFLSISCLFACPKPVSAQRTWYVNARATGLDNGLSWTDALVYLQDALSSADSGDEIWVAHGIYYPDQGTGISPGSAGASFVIPPGVALFGGFRGEELAPQQRDWNLFETVLSGDLAKDDNGEIFLENWLRRDNSHIVVRIRMVDETATSRLDGFTVSSGNGRDSSYGAGLDIRAFPPGGISGQIIIQNCRFVANATIGSTIWINVVSALDRPAVEISNSIVSNNSGLESSGIVVENGKTTINRVSFKNNTAGESSALKVINEDVWLSNSVIVDSGGGSAIKFVSSRNDTQLSIWNTRFANLTSNDVFGAISHEGGSLLSINNVFTGNSSHGSGGAIRTKNSVNTIINNVFAFNSAGEGGGAIQTEGSETHIANSIFWQNSAQIGPDIHSVIHSDDNIQIEYSQVQYDLAPGIVVGNGMLSGDPMFADPNGPDLVPGTADDDLRLTALSPGVDTGSNQRIPVDLFDADGDGDIQERWPTDIDGNARVFDALLGPVVDMGAFELYSPPIDTYREQKIYLVATQTRALSAYPNPTRSGFTLVIDRALPTPVNLELFSINGALIRTLYQGMYRPGDRVFTETINLAPGTYVIRESNSGVSSLITVVR